MRVRNRINRLETRIVPVKDVPRDAYGNPLPVLSPERRARAERYLDSCRRPDGTYDRSHDTTLGRDEFRDVIRCLLLRIHEARQRQHEQLHGNRVRSKLAALTASPNNDAHLEWVVVQA